MTANFIYGSVVLANNKSDGDQTTSTAKVVADEWNTSVDALYDTKGAITDGEYYQLKDMSGTPPATAGAGKVRFVNIGGELFTSADGNSNQPLYVYKDMREFGVVADDSTDCTAAIQAGLDWGYTQAAAQIPVKLVFPPGVMRISSTLVWKGTAAATPALYGAAPTGEAYDIANASVFKWTGADNETMMYAQRCNMGVMEDLKFNGNSKAGICLHLASALYADREVLAATNGIRINRCDFRHVKIQTVGNGCVALGSDDHPLHISETWQLSDVRFDNCAFVGEYVAAPGFNIALMKAYGVKCLDGGNCKLFSFNYCYFSTCDVGFDGTIGAGPINFLIAQMANVRTAFINNQARMSVIGADIECGDVDDFRFLLSSGGPGCTHFFTGVECAAFMAGSLGTLMVAGGSLLIQNSYFTNNNLSVDGTQPNPFKFIAGAVSSSGDGGSFTSINNLYSCPNSDGYIPIYDGSGNHIVPSVDYGWNQGLRVASNCDFGGVAVPVGSGTVALKSFNSEPTQFQETYTNSIRGGYELGDPGSSSTLPQRTFQVVNCTSAPDTITLPTAAAANKGRVIWVSKSDATTNTLTVTDTSTVLSYQYQTAQFVSDGSAWHELNPLVAGVRPTTSAWYDIRDYGAVPGASGKAATTAAFNAIFAAINWSYFPSVDGVRAAVIYVPAVEDDWYIGDVDDYVGSTGAGIYMKGDMPTSNSGTAGSAIVFDGTPGGTMFSFLAINFSTIENIGFNLGAKAKVGVKLAQKWYGPPHNASIPSNGVTFRNCIFFNPQGDYDSILVQAGDDTDPPNTYQAADYFFYNCLFLGHNTIQGWGFKTVVGGNTKNFLLDTCQFLYLYRGIEVTSGYLVARAVEGGNIGYDRDKNACMIYSSASSTDITGGGFENGTNGYFARWLITGQGSPVTVSGVYCDCTPPADDYVIDAAGPLTVQNCEWANGRATTNATSWAALTPVLLGQQRLNDTNKWYVCTVPGTTGNAGGPTGTGTNIADGGTVKWDWVATGDGNVAKFNAGQPTEGLNGSYIFENNELPYTSTPILGLPVYDGSNNILGAALGKAGTDYAKSVNQRVYARGNLTGLRGSNINQTLPDFDGRNVINQRDQFWTDNYTAGQTVLRNDNGVYIITVPAAVIAAQGVGVVSLGNMPAGYKITECIVDVTTLFSGPGVTGPKASIGNFDVGAPYNDILLAGAIDATGQFGLLGVERGAGWDSNRYIVPFATSAAAYLVLKCTVTGGNITDINAGSLNVYVQFQRLKL